MAKGFKTGGRKKGVPNAPKPYKQIVIKFISSAVSDYFESGLFDEDVKSLDPKDRIAMMEKLSQYVVPKQQSQKLDIAATANVSTSLSDKLSQMASQFDKSKK